MKLYRSHIISACFFAASIGFADDSIVLNNGDVLSGTVVEESADKVNFNSPVLGSIEIDTADISEVRKESNTIEKVETPKPVKPPVVKQPSQKKWSGQTGLAIALRENTSYDSAGNTVQDEFETYRFYGNLNWTGKRNDLNWNWTYRYSEDETRVRDDFFNITQNYKYKFSKQNYFASAKTFYQRDYNRRIENEFLQTAEMGIQWFEPESKMQLSTSAGGGYHAYERSDAVTTESTSMSEPKFIFNQSLRWNMINSLALIQKYSHLGDLKDYHFLFSAGVENKLIRELFLRFEYRLDRDTEVTYNDRGSYYDKALLTSLLYKF